MSLLFLALVVLAPAGSAWAQQKPELTVALSSFSTETLDPALGGHIVKYYLSMIFDYLVGSTLDGQPSPTGGIATRWENSPDYKRWTFHLRKGVKFHNGDDLTSEDVKFSLQRATGKRSTTGYAGPLRTLIQDIETPAPDRVVIVTKEPTLIIPTYLSRALSTEGMVLPKKYIEANGDDAFARKPVGSGPYRFVEQVTGSHIKLAAVDNHWRIGTPKYKTMMFRLVSEETTRIALLRRGEADVADVSRERVTELERESFPVHFRREEAILSMWWVFAPEGWPPPAKDKRVREAMNIAVDRNEIAQAIFAGPRRAGGHPHGPLVVVQGHRLQGGAGDDVHLRSRPGQEAPGRRGPSQRVRARRLCLSAPRPARGQGHGRGGGRVLGEDRHQAKAHPGGLPGVPQALGGPQGPGAVGYYNIANRNWIGAYRPLEKQAYSPSKANDTANDPGDRRHDREGDEARPTGRRSTRSCATCSRGCAASTTACPSCTCTRHTRRRRPWASGTPAR